MKSNYSIFFYFYISILIFFILEISFIWEYDLDPRDNYFDYLSYDRMLGDFLFGILGWILERKKLMRFDKRNLYI